MDNKMVVHGVSLGMVFAAVISFSLYHSFWWMWLHAVFGWFYVVYWGLFL